MTAAVPLKPGQRAGTCGNCQHWKPAYFTPSGRANKTKAGQCHGVVTLIAPIAYNVVLNKKYVWFKDDATNCPVWAALIEGKAK